MSSVQGMSSPLAINSLDHVALWVADRDAIADLACEHLGMHVIERTEKFTLVGAEARRFKLTLFAAAGPREPGALVAVILRVGDLEAALAKLPEDLVLERRDDGVVLIAAPEGLVLGLVERETDLDYDLDHVVLRVEDADESARALRLEQRQLEAARVGADEGELLCALDDMHPEVLAGEIGDRVPVRDPERDVVERVDGERGGHSLHATHRRTPPCAS